MKPSKPNVTLYIDYRTYLREVYEFLKSTEKRFSFQTFTDMLGFGNRSFIQNIIKGIKDLPESSLQTLGTALDLSDDELAFLTLLVQFDHATNPAEKDGYWRQIRQLQNPLVAKTIEKDKKLAVLERWHTLAVRELIDQGYSEPLKIARRLTPHVPVAEVREDIRLLLDLGYITEEPNGKYKVTDPQCIASASEDIGVKVIRAFQSQMMDRAKDSLATIPPNERKVETLTGTFSEAHFQRIQKKLSELLHEFAVISNEPMLIEGEADTRRVYQINLACFPLTAKPERVDDDQPLQET